MDTEYHILFLYLDWTFVLEMKSVIYIHLFLHLHLPPQLGGERCRSMNILSEEEPYSLFVVVVIFQMARGKLSFNHNYVTRVKLRRGLRCLLYWKVKYLPFNSMNYLAILIKQVNKRKEMPNQSLLAGWKHKGLSWKCHSAVKTELNTHSKNHLRPAGLGLCCKISQTGCWIIKTYNKTSKRTDNFEHAR